MTATGQLAMKLGLERAAERDLDWTERATFYIASMRSGREFTSDDVHQACGDPNGSGNSVGALVKHCERRGWLEPCGFQRSTRVEARGRVLVRWRRR